MGLYATLRLLPTPDPGEGDGGVRLLDAGLLELGDRLLGRRVQHNQHLPI